MNINILTIFPEIFDVLNSGVLSKAIKNKIISFDTLDIRKNASNKHNHVDSKPYGGGEGMVMNAEPIVKTLKQIDQKNLGKVLFMSPQGERLNQNKVISLSKLKNITIICGRYEGIDQRVIDKYVDEEISVGDFILSGGEYAAICLIDAISRHIPGTLGNKDSYLKDTFSNGLLKGDVYAKPENFDSMLVPEVLLSGNHQKIEQWRKENSLLKTFIKRPDLLKDIKLTKKQKKLLEEWASKAIL
ncbi:MAG: tRNA (guanine-N(1)-)-methyltransferase [Flavobacterium sp. SCGC AAA160-P02]|nr:MAG: tRNA (guanine-N(1)-)-methyltransferase [Flavobacterium sp. SCGC AAA160-P02]|tara:strand:- start:376 stop:1107 length:732 start_codon:yes stop_codon:yes gene_type:complete